MPRPLSTPGTDPVPIVQEAGWSPGPVWTGAENIATTGIRSPDRPARSSVAIPTTLPGPRPTERISFNVLCTVPFKQLASVLNSCSHNV
jgi:hypothetical protein